MKIQVRPAHEGDLDAILSLDRKTDTAPHWQPEHYALLLEGPGPQRNGILGVAVLQQNNSSIDVTDDVIGFIAGHRLFDEAELESIVVNDMYRRQGIAHKLVDWFTSIAKVATIHLEVRPSNLPALELYKSLGFNVYAKRPGYYSSPTEDALLLKRKFS